MIGEALRLIRVFHDTKLFKLAEDLDVSTSYLSAIENQKKKPTVEIIEKYAKHFKIPTSSIMFFHEELDKKSIPLKNAIREKLITFLKAIEPTE